MYMTANISAIGECDSRLELATEIWLAILALVPAASPPTSPSPTTSSAHSHSPSFIFSQLEFHPYAIGPGLCPSDPILVPEKVHVARAVYRLAVFSLLPHIAPHVRRCAVSPWQTLMGPTASWNWVMTTGLESQFGILPFLIDAFDKFTSLNRLVLQQVYISPGKLPALTTLRALEHLEVDKCQLHWDDGPLNLVLISPESRLVLRSLKIVGNIHRLELHGNTALLDQYVRVSRSSRSKDGPLPFLVASIAIPSLIELSLSYCSHDELITGFSAVRTPQSLEAITSLNLKLNAEALLDIVSPSKRSLTRAQSNFDFNFKTLPSRTNFVDLTSVHIQPHLYFLHTRQRPSLWFRFRINFQPRRSTFHPG
ncbi:hypothetical protein DFH08DRAFT_1051895 [Mycena albidolilacea]|uniref:Uncharacterized protein n=1 Tax=Mycena albidolilacea TaxID=1033008 RepID=A0AAD7ACE3_9AGAR|nr:hypothetical protein DFH08DRAFT_1051895 [Mycena albidolilacea]